MRRPAIVTITTIGAAAVAAATLASTGSAQPTGPPTGELHLVSRGQSVTLVDNPPRQPRNRPPSRGDGFIMTEKIFDPASGDRIGRGEAACTIIDASHGRLVCTGVAVLPQGRIMFQGGDKPPLAITGGTGAFAGARGTVDSRQRDGRMDVTVRFAG
jgi:hypothetical protein